jgi:beta-phosphoglucomutase-like phosphatase (HAD superfamily)
LYCATEQVEVLSGALQLIDRLLELNLPLAIATSSSAKIVAVKRRAHPGVFDRVAVLVCGDDAEVASGKPSPDIFLLAGIVLYCTLVLAVVWCGVVWCGAWV